MARALRQSGKQRGAGVSPARLEGVSPSVRVSRKRGRDARATGFSLIEILIAIGILGVCLPMAAALFATAAKENQGSYENAMGSLICDNGLTIVKTKVPYSTTGDPALFEDLTGKIGTADGAYPTGTSPAQKGFLALRRPLSRLPNNDADNDYQVFVVSYSKDDANNTCTWSRIVGGNLADDAASGRSRITAAGLQPGAFIIIEAPVGSIGTTAQVGNMQGGSGLLDRKLPITGAITFWTIIENNGVPISPAMSIISARTSM